MKISTVTLSRLGANLWKIIWEIYKKIDKISIGDEGTVEKIWQKLEKVLVLRFWVIFVEILKKKQKNIWKNVFENVWENL